jgi:hypothetical protein
LQLLRRTEKDEAGKAIRSETRESAVRNKKERDRGTRNWETTTLTKTDTNARKTQVY